MREAYYLFCPSCGEPCTAIAPCSDEDAHPECCVDHREVPDEHRDRYWCDDRSGTCACGARLCVEIDDDYAFLVEIDDDYADVVEDLPGGSDE